MSVFVEDAAESIASSDVEVGESVRFGDRLGERAKGCRGVEADHYHGVELKALALVDRHEGYAIRPLERVQRIGPRLARIGGSRDGGCRGCSRGRRTPFRAL
jgi:hypothetical protein